MRDRLLAAANELFYEEGIHGVGIERVLERAQVAKASLYSTFGSKDDLVRAYLEARDQRRRKRIGAALEKHASPRARILAVYDVLGEVVRESNYRGCAFVNASAEGMRPESKAKRVCDDSRAWLRALFTSLARELGADGRRGERRGRGACTRGAADRLRTPALAQYASPSLAADAR